MIHPSLPKENPATNKSGGYPSKIETEQLINLLAAEISHDPAAAAADATESPREQKQIQIQIHSLVQSELGETLPLHISLSKPISLATHQRQSFIDRLMAEVGRGNIRPYVYSMAFIERLIISFFLFFFVFFWLF